MWVSATLAKGFLIFPFLLLLPSWLCMSDVCRCICRGQRASPQTAFSPSAFTLVPGIKIPHYPGWQAWRANSFTQEQSRRHIIGRTEAVYGKLAFCTYQKARGRNASLSTLCIAVLYGKKGHLLSDLQALFSMPNFLIVLLRWKRERKR